MKTAVKTLLAIPLFLFPLATSLARECVPFDEERDCLTLEETDERRDGYNANPAADGIVHYGLCDVLCADPGTFRPMRLEGERADIYGKDLEYVFFRFTPLMGIDPKQVTLRVMGESGYYLAHDRDTAYLNAIPMPEIDPETFEFLDTLTGEWESWFRDKNHVYHLTQANDSSQDRIEILPGADPTNFVFGYKLTPETVFWYGKRIPEADAGSFETPIFYDNGLAKDKNNVYNKGKVLYGTDVMSFQLYDVKRKGMATLEVKMDSVKAEDIKKRYPAETPNIEKSVQSAIAAYETKYPGYTPKPAHPPKGSPEEAELLKMEAETRAEQAKQIALWGGSAIGGLMVLGGGMWIWKRRKGKK